MAKVSAKLNVAGERQASAAHKKGAANPFVL